MAMRTALTASAGTAAAWCLPALAPVFPPVAGALGIPRRREGAEGPLLTFDDGPHPEGTPATLEALREAGAKATFFLVGEQVERFPSIALEVAEEGHAIGIHGYRHHVQLRVPPRTLAADLDRAHAVIAEATGADPALYRPPLGIFSPTGLREVRARDWDILLWSRWGHDWRRSATPQSIAREVTRDLSADDVLLLHDADWYSSSGSWRATVEALPAVLAAMPSLAPRTTRP
jgi:peptidoglycan/xylan/chitin deacetylase (PgdA/CDA1 family)